MCECGVTSVTVVDVFSGKRVSRVIRPHDEFFLHVDHVDEVYDDEFSSCEDVFFLGGGDG